jgi:hypothetical protein
MKFDLAALPSLDINEVMVCVNALVKEEMETVGLSVKGTKTENSQRRKSDSLTYLAATQSEKCISDPHGVIHFLDLSPP